MIEPRYQKMSILGYGGSVATLGIIEAEIIVVRDYAELEERSDEVRASSFQIKFTAFENQC